MSFFYKYYKYFTNWRWELGFLDNTLEEVVNGEPLRVHWVKLPFRDRWFADPFIVDYNDTEIILLCEEYSDKLKRGRIAKLIIGRHDYELKSWVIVLDRPTHLSFPRIIRKGEILFVHPENSASGSHTLYRYDFEKEALVDGRVICDLPLTDSVILENDKEHLLFSTSEPDPNGKILTIYENNNGIYTKKNDVIFHHNYARMAGDFFSVNGDLYRPAQDCDEGYGKAVIIQKASCYNGDQWSFSNVRRLDSTHPVLNWGLHTFNHYKGLIVIDVKGPRYPRIAKLLLGAHSFFNSFL